MCWVKETQDWKKNRAYINKENERGGKGRSSNQQQV